MTMIDKVRAEMFEAMKEKDKELYEKTVEDLKKLDRNTLVMLNVSIKMLVARQEMDENKPTTAA
mgnify:CR=1 FL=1